MKSIYLEPIQFVAKFEPAKGTYYDHVAEIYTSSLRTEIALQFYLLKKGWNFIKPTWGGLVIFEKDRHIIRATRLWGEEVTE